MVGPTGDRRHSHRILPQEAANPRRVSRSSRVPGKREHGGLNPQASRRHSPCPPPSGAARLMRDAVLIRLSPPATGYFGGDRFQMVRVTFATCSFNFADGFPVEVKARIESNQGRPITMNFYPTGQVRS
jgi:hypothetical protein